MRHSNADSGSTETPQSATTQKTIRVRFFRPRSIVGPGESRPAAAPNPAGQKLRPALHAEMAKDRLQILIDGVLADPQSHGDLLVPVPFQETRNTCRARGGKSPGDGSETRANAPPTSGAMAAYASRTTATSRSEKSRRPLARLKTPPSAGRPHRECCENRPRYGRPRSCGKPRRIPSTAANPRRNQFAAPHRRPQFVARAAAIPGERYFQRKQAFFEGAFREGCTSANVIM